MNILLWVFRILLLLLVIRFVVQLLSGGRRNQARRAPGRGSMEQRGGELVRDPNCGTYVPKARAIVAGAGDDARYFCSAKCRDEYTRSTS